jgi:ABC-2 type transport system ATP-binding protein
MLHLTNFRKAYQQQVVVQVQAFTLASGGYWLHGSNGAGKSTLLKALAGMTTFEGEMRWSDYAEQLRALSRRSG